MSIRERQLTNEAKRVLQKELLKGRYPDLSTVQQLVSEKFDQRVPGLPRFELKPVANKQVSNAAHYNEMTENLHEDLSVAFDEVRYQGDRMMALADYYETEKYRVGLQIRKLNRRMEILKEKLEDRGLRDVLFETFDNFLNIEYDGDKTRSIPVTDAFVDLRHGAVSLDTIRSSIAKIDLSSAHPVVSPVTPFEEFMQLGAIDNALKDTVNESWRHKATTTEPSAAEMMLTIELEKEEIANFLSFTPMSARPTTIILGLSQDGTTYTEELPRIVTSLTEWNVETRAIKFIRFRLQKTEPDFANGTEYDYYFGAQNISMKRVAFTETGLFVGKEQEVKRIVDKITLKTDEVVPAGTKIEYFLAEDKMDGGILEWQSIRPNQMIQLNSLLTETVPITNTSTSYGAFYETLYSQNYYSIIKLDKAPLARTVTILAGEGMYQVDSMDYVGDATFIPTLDTWKSAKEYETSFIPLSETSAGKRMTVEKGKVERMTLYVMMVNDYLLYANPFDKAADIKVSVYLNNMEIKPISGNYTYPFKKGMNKVEILYYAPTGGFIAPNLARTYLESIGATQIYGTNQSLKQIDIYDLLNNTSKKDYTKFAVDEDNNIVLNYNPKSFDRSGNGVQYTVTYRYPSDLSKTSTHLRLMAKLYRNSNGDLSPILNAYKLIIE